MVEERAGQPSPSTASWTKIFSAFRIALDPKKLLLAGAGILVMAAGWWLLALLFYLPYSTPPKWDPPMGVKPDSDESKEAWVAFKANLRKWNLLHEAAGPPLSEVLVDAADIADSPEEYNRIKPEIEAMQADPKRAKYKVAGRLRTWPWFEDRGPNQFLLVTGKVKPWEQGQFVNWLLSDQLPVLVEPLVKFLRPVIYLLDPAAGAWNRLYLVLVIVWTLATWAVFGGAITRIAAVQVARPNEKITLAESLRFAVARLRYYFSAPLFPLLFIALMTLILIFFGIFAGLIPIFGDIFVAGLLWPIVLIIGLVMAVVLVGLVGWPLMYATISAEGSDSFDALSRSYSYVYQAPWQYIWYSVVALVYGAVLVFFVGFMGSLLVYMGKWGVSQAPFLQSQNPAKDREPTYLFVYAPTSFGWRDLMLSKSQFSQRQEVIKPSGVHTEGYTLTKDYMDNLTWYNKTGAGFVSFWLFLVFLLVVGFGYSFFWTASTIIYLLMRQKVDDTELDEIHLEETEEQPFAPPPSTTTATKATPGNVGLSMVDPPVLRTSPAAPATSGAALGESPQPPPTDGPAQPGGA